MSTNDFSQARGALANTLTVLVPVINALQQADSVFGVLANAEKHKKVLEAEVTALKTDLEKTKTAVQKQQQKLKDVIAEIGIAETDADTRINEVLENEQKRVTAAKVQAATAVADYAKQTSEAQRAHMDALAKAQAESAEVMSELAAKEARVNANVVALEKKLDTLRASAQKFAAALTGE